MSTSHAPRIPSTALLVALAAVVVGAYVTVWLVGLDLAGLYWQSEGGGLPIGHGAHLGGAAAGVLFYLFFIAGRGLRRTNRRDYGDVATWRQLMSEQGRRELDGK